MDNPRICLTPNYNRASWPSAFNVISGPQDAVIITREVGKGAYQLDADPPVVNRPIRNKSKCKQQRKARKRAKK